MSHYGGGGGSDRYGGGSAGGSGGGSRDDRDSRRDDRGRDRGRDDRYGGSSYGEQRPRSRSRDRGNDRGGSSYGGRDDRGGSSYGGRDDRGGSSYGGGRESSYGGRDNRGGSSYGGGRESSSYGGRDDRGGSSYGGGRESAYSSRDNGRDDRGGSSYGGGRDDRGGNGRGGGYGGGAYGPSSGGSNYGGDRGGRGYGGGGRGGGRGGGGRNTSMADDRSISSFMSSNEFSDPEILKIVSPEDASQATRDTFMTDADGVLNPTLPPLKNSTWRMQANECAGKLLDPPTQIVRSNHFRLPINNLKDILYQYYVHIYKIQRDGTVHGKDLVQEGDMAVNFALLNKLRRKKEAEWGSDKIGLTYDGRSTIFSTARLFPRNHPNGPSVLRPPPIPSGASDSHYGPGGADGASNGESVPNPESKNAAATASVRGSLSVSSNHENIPEGFYANKDSEESRNFDYADDIQLSESSPMKFHIRIREVIVIKNPANDPSNCLGWGTNNKSYERAMDSVLLQFVRWDSWKSNPEWFTVKSKAFNNGGQNMIELRNSPGTICMKGYTISLKASLAGLSLISDMTISCFQQGCTLLQLIITVGRYRSAEDAVAACNSNGGAFPRQVQDAVVRAMRGIKMKTRHLGRTEKFKRDAFSHPADSEDPKDKFPYKVNGEDRDVTVAEYFEEVAKINPIYANCMHHGKLRYPSLPCINIGSRNDTKKAVFVPIEMLEIPSCQPRHELSPDLVSQIIRHAAVKPAERQSFIKDASINGIISQIRKDGDAKAFGVDVLEGDSMQLSARLLPPAKLMYGNGRIVNPELKGAWNYDGVVAHKPKNSIEFTNPQTKQVELGYAIACIFASFKPPSDQQKDDNERFMKGIISAAHTAGINIMMGSKPSHWNCSSDDELTRLLALFKSNSVRLAVVLMQDECYGMVKNIADNFGMVTQCIKYKNVANSPRGFAQNVLLKINTKMGGTNHTLASRLPSSDVAAAAPTFQMPPKSISWVFDEPCMLVGMDVSHPEPGQEGKSMAAVVGSMDGYAGQYVAMLSAEVKHNDLSGEGLRNGMEKLIKCFQKRNNVFPKRIVIYRDGISEGQFTQVLDQELAQIHDAIELCGGIDVKVALIVCTKRHNLRLFYEDSRGEVANPCSGLVIDSTGGSNSIVSSQLNEFYLNSHATIQGTARSARYTLLHDEIGFKISELELLTYWSTYLYCRCNRSVGIATPAYYAHWAASRAKLLTVKVDEKDMTATLDKVSTMWAENEDCASMFFI